MPGFSLAKEMTSASDLWGESARTTSTDRKSTRLNSSHSQISYAVFCLKKKKMIIQYTRKRTRLNTSHSQISDAVFCFNRDQTTTALWIRLASGVTHYHGVTSEIINRPS